MKTEDILKTEEAVIGAVILEKSAIEQVYNLLQYTDFLNAKAGAVYKAATELLEKNSPIDLITISAAVKDAVSMYEVAQFTSSVNSAANITYHAAIIKQQAQKRSYLRAAAKIEEQIKQDSDIEEIENSFIAALETGLKATTDTALNFDKVLMEIIEEKQANKTAFIATPSLAINNELTILAARPSMGKTSFALNLMIEAAKEGFPSLLFSLEMDKRTITKKILSSISGIDSELLIERPSSLINEDLNKLADAVTIASTLPIFIEETGGLTLEELKIKARIEVKKKGIKLIVIDYLQLIRLKQEKGLTREVVVATISKEIAALRKELSMPIILLCQLSRGVENRVYKEPMLSDLRESGSIEQDADRVIFLYRPEYYGIRETEEGMSTKNLCFAITGKNRNGKLSRNEYLFIKHKNLWNRLDSNN